jgi:cation transport regulator
MPYNDVSELPESVRSHLPRHAQEIYRAAFNNAWNQYKDPGERRGKESREEAAHKVAWAAVKHEYEKDPATGDWHARGSRSQTSSRR